MHGAWRWLGVVGWLCALAAQAADVAPLRIDEPQAWGHTVGDVLQRRVHLASGQSLAADALPKPHRVDTWFELRQAQLQGRGDAQQLVLDYQLINAPQKVSTLALPALRLALAGPDKATLDLPEWPVSAGPITAEVVLSRAGLPVQQPDIAPLAPSRQPLVLRLLLWAALALLAAAVLLLRRHPEWAWWRRHAPFRDALRDLRRLPHEQAEAARVASQRLHRAFDQAAGAALFGPGLKAWLAQRPGLAPLAPQIESFFAGTQRGFFEADAPLPPTAEVLALCRRLARAEGQGA
jgi:mxaA protein